MVKRLLLANDLPGLGKVALSASIPIVAACQVETVLLPTVLLSSHTGGFPQVVIKEQTTTNQEFLQQWKALDLDLSAILSGYCKTPQQLSLLADYSRVNALPLIVDPVMGDGGRLYRGFDQSYVEAMRDYVATAKLILPNLTEAALLTGRDYLGDQYHVSDIEDLIAALARQTSADIVLTGVSLEPDQLGVVYFQQATGQMTSYMSPKLPAQFFGTGDILASLLAVAWIEKLDIHQALPVFLDFIHRSLDQTLSLQRDLKLGIYFEPFLADLSRGIQTLKAEQEA